MATMEMSPPDATWVKPLAVSAALTAEVMRSSRANFAFVGAVALSTWGMPLLKSFRQFRTVCNPPQASNVWPVLLYFCASIVPAAIFLHLRLSDRR
jgi:hypothetical protein